MELLKTGQVARELGLSRFQVNRLIRSGRLRAVRMGRDHWIRRADLEAFADGKRSSADRLAREWGEIVGPAAEVLDRGVRAIDGALNPWTAVVHRTLAAGERWAPDDERRFVFGLRTVLATPGQMPLLTRTQNRLMYTHARALAELAGRDAPTRADLELASWQAPMFTAWLARLVATGWRDRTVDVIRAVAVEWNVDLPRAQAVRRVQWSS